VEKAEPDKPVKARKAGSFRACDDNMTHPFSRRQARPVFENRKMKIADPRMRGPLTTFSKGLIGF